MTRVTASIRVALKAHFFSTAIGTGGLAILLPIFRWAYPADFVHFPSTPLVILLIAVVFQVAIFLIMLIGWSWYRLHTWTLDAHGIACERCGRSAYTLPWEQVRVVSLLWLGVHFDTTDGKRHYLGFVDSRLVREAVPAEKRRPPNTRMEADAATPNEGDASEAE